MNKNRIPKPILSSFAQIKQNYYQNNFETKGKRLFWKIMKNSKHVNIKTKIMLAEYTVDGKKMKVVDCFVLLANK